MGPRRWTGCPRSRSGASPSPRPPPPVPGTSTGSTSSTRRATSISRWRSSVPCECSMVRSPCSMLSPAYSPSPRRSGVRADQYNVPRIAFINKMDRVGADFDRVVDDAGRAGRQRRSSVQFPWGREESFAAMHRPFGDEGPALPGRVEGCRLRSSTSRTTRWRRRTSGATRWSRRSPRQDDLLLEAKYLDSGDRSPTTELRWVPSCDARPSPAGSTRSLCGSAFKNKGVQPLLDAVVNCLPLAERDSPDHPRREPEENRAEPDRRRTRSRLLPSRS